MGPGKAEFSSKGTTINVDSNTGFELGQEPIVVNKLRVTGRGTERILGWGVDSTKEGFIVRPEAIGKLLVPTDEPGLYSPASYIDVEGVLEDGTRLSLQPGTPIRELPDSHTAPAQ